MSISDRYRRAWILTVHNYVWFLTGLAGIVLVWLLVEWVVIISPFAENPLIWWVVHIGYFFLTAIPETMLIRIANNVAAGRKPNSRVLPNITTVVRYTILKFAALPVFFLGLYLLVLPGLWLGSRLIFSGFSTVIEARPVVASVRNSITLSRGRTGHLMLLVFSLVLINLLGLALLGFGLLFTIPLSYIVLAEAYQEALGESF